MSDCIFCKIVAGHIPSHTLYEDDKFIAFLDINPKTKGHTLLLTKEHYAWPIDVPNFGEYFEAAKKIGLQLQEKLGATFVSFQTFGTEVAHAHIHIVPFYSMTEESHRTRPSTEELLALLKKIKEV
jgi:histidine triad (HIT) family protein